jgi:hypothetical protein
VSVTVTRPVICYLEENFVITAGLAADAEDQE